MNVFDNQSWYTTNIHQLTINIAGDEPLTIKIADDDPFTIADRWPLTIYSPSQ